MSGFITAKQLDELLQKELKKTKEEIIVEIEKQKRIHDELTARLDELCSELMCSESEDESDFDFPMPIKKKFKKE